MPETFVFGDKENFSFTDDVRDHGMGALFGVIESLMHGMLGDADLSGMEIYEDYEMVEKGYISAATHGKRKWSDMLFMGLFDGLDGWIEEIIAIDDILELKEVYPQKYKILKDKELSREEKYYITPLRQANTLIHNHVNGWYKDKGVDTFAKRRLVVGDSMQTAEAWTDGFSFIAIDKDVFRKYAASTHGAVHHVLNLILHEYVHGSDSSMKNVHGEEFYRDFHELAFGFMYKHKGFGYVSRGQDTLYDIVHKTSRNVVKRMQKGNAKIPSKTSKMFTGVKRSLVESTILMLKLFDTPVRIRNTGYWEGWDVNKKDKRYPSVFQAVAKGISENHNDRGTIYVEVDADDHVHFFIKIDTVKIFLKEKVAADLLDYISGDKKAVEISSLMKELSYEMALLGYGHFWFKIGAKNNPKVFYSPSPTSERIGAACFTLNEYDEPNTYV